LKDETEELRVYVGWDSREDIAYQVCKKSIEALSTIPVKVIPLKQKQLRANGDYWRDEDKLASTEFTFTRFLIPHLNGYKGWALFVDCDFVFLKDIKRLFNQRNNKYAVMCAQHDYTPKEGTKMDGKQQTNYPRKNWSSMMLINCGHPSNQKLTIGVVNDKDTTGAYLHRFSWLDDSEIGKISHSWNWLVGWYKEPDNGRPMALHYTEGGPWFSAYRDCEYANEYYKVERVVLQDQINLQKNKFQKEIERIKTIDDLSIADDTKDHLKKSLKKLVDPDEQFYKGVPMKPIRVVSIQSDAPYASKGLKYDPLLENFVQGSGGKISTWDREKESTTTLLIRGLSTNCQQAIQHCWDTGRKFIYMDTGYLGNYKHKTYHRLTLNNVQHLGPLIERPYDRIQKIGYKFKKRKGGDEILICPPSKKVMKFYGLELDQWLTETVQQIKHFTDRKIVIRSKPARSDRITTNTIYSALDKAHCLVTFNSIAATEALLYGIPAIALAPNAATLFCNTSIEDIDSLYKPVRDDMEAFAAHLSYAQFTPQEMISGYAWNVLNESD
jgi:lipopolysaccharide biosynthesis glycosyltransferase